MRYVLCIKQPIYGAQGGYLAYQVAQALVEQGHQISQIFFFQQGVTIGNEFVYPANDEFHLQAAWQDFSRQYHVPLHLCIAAAQRRGVVDTQTAPKASQTNLATHFVLAGLGEFNQALLEADRVLTL
ncbi:sulfurtransferase complex subunit TusD [Pasteurella oralis]|uniref:Sulfurtransferase complex subunit TusD n=1 Tax=Pasteurella oralis TaxID=1071947 RepID=A0ABW4NVA5_9PAST